MKLPFNARLIANKSFVVRIGDFFADMYLAPSERFSGWTRVNTHHIFTNKSISDTEKQYGRARWSFASVNNDVPNGYRELAGDELDNHVFADIDYVSVSNSWSPVGSWSGQAVKSEIPFRPSLRVCVPDNTVEMISAKEYKPLMPRPSKLVPAGSARIKSYPPRLIDGYEILSDKEVSDYTLAKGDYFIFKEKSNWEMISVWAGRKAAEFLHKKQFLVAVKREPKAKFPTDKPYPFGW